MMMKVRQIYQEIIAKNNNKHNFFAELLFSRSFPDKIILSIS